MSCCSPSFDDASKASTCDLTLHERRRSKGTDSTNTAEPLVGQLLDRHKVTTASTYQRKHILLPFAALIWCKLVQAISISSLLLSELAALPISTSAGGFAYRLNPGLGSVERSTDSFGPFFTERSLTVGKGLASFSASYQRAIFVDIDGHDLRDGSLISTASALRGDAQPFDVETMSLNIHTDTVTLAGSPGRGWTSGSPGITATVTWELPVPDQESDR